MAQKSWQLKHTSRHPDLSLLWPGQVKVKTWLMDPLFLAPYNSLSFSFFQQRSIWVVDTVLLHSVYWTITLISVWFAYCMLQWNKMWRLIENRQHVINWHTFSSNFHSYLLYVCVYIYIYMLYIYPSWDLEYSRCIVDVCHCFVRPFAVIHNMFYWRLTHPHKCFTIVLLFYLSLSVLQSVSFFFLSISP